jgi:hypothetical protein
MTDNHTHRGDDVHPVEAAQRDNELRAIYRNSYYKDLRKWLISRHFADKAQISYGEFVEMTVDAVAEFHDTIIPKEDE